MAKQKVMNIAALKAFLTEIGKEVGDDYQVWLSSDEEGNQFLPMPGDPRQCIELDPDKRRIVLFPMHWQPEFDGD